ncbi:unnamed protein product [Clonostachys chloroleuca]|uniref:Zn(2)-C6 fungal-type domain-containing protein n=1 Tax=Clonostachys chloroleuca TaxID=1926264 RepID=A0AA35QC51_9HYPO|nr:unnamed protein product [Clonostachys chloroleuca]
MSDEDSSIQVSGLDGTESAAGSTPVRRRRGLKRSSAACHRCRQRKQKCDGKHPSCEPCLAAGVTCIPSERLVVRSDPCCECEQLRDQVQALRSENERLRHQLDCPVDSFQPEFISTPVLEVPLEDPAPPLTPSSSRRETQTNSEEHVAYSGRILLPTFRRRNTGDGANTSFLTSPWHLWHGLNADAGATPGVSLPSYLTDTGEFAELFFARRWPQFPVLHKPTFMKDVYGPFITGEICNGLTKFQANIVLAIGASEKSRTGPGEVAVHDRFFEAAIQHLGAVLASDDVSCIQSLLLLCIYGSNEPERVDLWYTVGLALRLALGIDMHRQETTPCGSFVQEEMRKRLFWSIYTMDRSISIAMGRPTGLQDVDITAALPLCLSDDQLLQPRETAVPSVLPSPDDLSTFLHIIRLRRINAEIYTALHAAGNAPVEGTNPTRYHYLAMLNAWLAAAPRYIGPTSMHQTAEWQQIAYHQAVLTLFRPSFVSPVVSVDGMRLCADSAISLVSCYHSLYAKNKVSYTFVALVSLFMAAITILYVLRASPLLRQELTREVTQSNVASCAAALRRISGGRSVGERSAQIVERLGKSILALFEATETVDEEVDTEFMSWFGLRCQQPSVESQTTPSIDVAWIDLLDEGFDLRNNFYSDAFI